VTVTAPPTRHDRRSASAAAGTMLRRIIVLRLLARARLSRSSFTEASTVTVTATEAARGLTVTDRDATRSRGHTSHGAGPTVPAAESLSGSDHARVQVLSPRHGPSLSA
jgi:hypothetical protein